MLPSLVILVTVVVDARILFDLLVMIIMTDNTREKEREDYMSTNVLRSRKMIGWLVDH